MGWVEFIKAFEDEDWVEYHYSHDCRDYDGKVKVRKVKEFSEDNVFIVPSKSDVANHKFAYNVAARIYTWIKNDQPLLDKCCLAYG